MYEDDQFERVITSYFLEIFTSERAEDRETVSKALNLQVTDEMNNNLITIPNQEEISEAAFDIHADKVSGPDGFSASFFHINLDYIAKDVVDEVQRFFQIWHHATRDQQYPHSTHPENSNAKSVKEYRPIALCNVYYKIISKIITKRLQPILNSIISENQ